MRLAWRWLSQSGMSLARGEGRNQAKMRAKVLKAREHEQRGCIGAGNVAQESSAYGGHAEAFARVFGAERGEG